MSATQALMVSSWRAGLVVRLIMPGELERFNAELGAHHWLGHRLSGRVLRYIATVEGVWVALVGFGSAALSCTVREELLGWDLELRLRRLGLITASQRFCVLPAGRRPGLASAVLGRCLRRLSADHLAVWGHPVLVVETFTEDPGRVLSQEPAGQVLIAVWEDRAALGAARSSQTAIKLVRGGEQRHLLRSSTGCEVTPAASDRSPPRGTYHRLLK